MDLETDALRLEMLQATGGVSVASPNGSLIAQFQNGYVEQNGVRSRRPTLTARDCDIVRLGIEPDTELQVNGSTYYVKVIEPFDDPGFSFITLKNNTKR